MAEEKGDDSGQQVAVIDSGSGFIKAGFTNEISPTIVLPTVIGQSKELVGFEAQSQLDTNDLLRPMQHGVITNWDEMEKIWNFTLSNELKIEKTSDIPCLVTQSSSATRDNREKMLHIFFEGMDVPAFYLSNQQVLSLYANSRQAGLVIDCGFDTCHVVPVYEGYPVSKNVLRLDVGGIDLTNNLRDLLITNGIVKKEDRLKEDIIRSIKEKCCYVSKNIETDLKDNSYLSNENQKLKSKFALPDGNTIELKQETIIIPEILFNPTKYLTNKANNDGNNGNNGNNVNTGISELVQKAFSSCEDKIQKEICDKIELVGGGCMFDGLGARLESDLKNNLLKDVNNLKITESKERKYAAWIGGSIFAGLSTFKDMWISSDEWEESGPSVVHRCQTLG